MANFTAKHAQYVHRISGVTGKKIALAKTILGAGQYQPDGDMFDDSVVDYFYNLFEFCVVRGMPWKEVVSAVKFANEFLSFIPEITVEKAIRHLHVTLVEYVKRDLLGSESAKKLTRFFVQTVINHFKLYQFFLSKPQELQSHSDELLVEVPPEGEGHLLLPLSIAETAEDWKFNRKMKALHEKHDQRLQEVDIQKEALVERSNEVDQSIDTALQDVEFASSGGELEFDKAKSLVMSLTSDKLGLVDDNLSLVIDKMKEDLSFEIESKALISARNNPPGKPGSRGGSAKSGKSKKGKKK